MHPYLAPALAITLKTAEFVLVRDAQIKLLALTANEILLLCYDSVVRDDASVHDAGAGRVPGGRGPAPHVHVHAGLPQEQKRHVDPHRRRLLVRYGNTRASVQPRSVERQLVHLL